MEDMIKAVELWAEGVGLLDADPSVQLLKVHEEVAEASQAYIREQPEELVMEVGDILVTLIIFAKQNDIELSKALVKAYYKVIDRRGELRKGSFVKEEDL